MTPFSASLADVQPSQLYVSERKLQVVSRAATDDHWFRANPIPLKRLCGAVVCTDGHTRALAAHLAGRTQAPACWDEDELDWEAYDICVWWCRDEGIRSIPDLAGRVVDEETYEREWLARCRRMHEQLRRRRECAARLALTVDKFLAMLSGLFGERLVSVLLHGSAVFEDLAPGYGDLDFVAVVEGDLTEEDRQRLVALRRVLRAEGSDPLEKMLEGAFLPRHMLDPAVEGHAWWWGTTKERSWSSNALGPLVHHVIRQRGRVIWGRDIRMEIPEPSREAMLNEMRRFCLSAREHGRGGGLHSVDWLLTAARLLLFLREGRLSSKSEAADWGARHAAGTWKEGLAKARHLRRNPWEADSPGCARWLSRIMPVIHDAVAELESEVARSAKR